MKRREFLKRAAGASVTWGALGSLSALGQEKNRKERPPNFLFILVDDLGWADLPCYGNSYTETPHIDRLAREGMRFTDAYAACPVCSPTRASLLSGQYPARLHLTDFIPGHWRRHAKLQVPEMRMALPADVTTIPEALKSRGYVSCHIGKWHLGGKNDPSPQEHGFSVSVPSGQNENDKRVAAYTETAIRFMKNNKETPFFLYMAHHTVHIPLEAREELIAKYEKKAGGKDAACHPTYAAMIETLDESVGRLVKTLEDLSLDQNTVVIFYSDNGGLIRRFDEKGPVVTSNHPLRSEKGTLYEGGIRVPLIVKWPGHVEENAVSKVPVSTVDFLPTLLACAGAEEMPFTDGVSLLPLLEGRGVPEREALFWHYPHYHHMHPGGAVRKGNYKLIEMFEDGSVELFDLEKDPSETTNLAEKLPEKAKQLQAELATWRQSVDAQMPKPNPEYDPAKAHEWHRRKR